MSTDDEFADLMLRVRAGDAEAAEEVVRRYEDVIRREVRVRLRMQDERVRRLLDSMDITQSVLASFFVGVASGQYDPETPQQLLSLLTTMARNKLLNHVRHQRQQRRDARRVIPLGTATDAVPDHEETPSKTLAGKELVAAFRNRFSDEERQLSAARHEGRSWTEIAAELGGTADGRRKQLERAYARIAKDLGLDEDVPQT